MNLGPRVSARKPALDTRTGTSNQDEIMAKNIKVKCALNRSFDTTSPENNSCMPGCEYEKPSATLR